METRPPPEDTWPIVNHYVTAHLMAAFEEATPSDATGLDTASEACFDGNIATFQEK